MVLYTQNDSFEVYALVPGLLQDEVRVQSDPAGRLVITGRPNQLDNPWGVTSFKKLVTLPARNDQLRTNDVLTFHGCLHVHVPFAQQNL
uniref:SHSP domain-containing protein n=1 Tax=Solanum lycopersicum TaxID=4081 RepID=A0A3Q7EV49_SOLLC